MDTYPTNIVPADTRVMVRDLRAGDVIRSFSGLADMVTVTGIVDHGMSQYARLYDVHYSDGSRSTYVKGDDVRYLATGGPRTPDAAPAEVPAEDAPELPAIGSVADAEYVANLYGEVLTLRGVVVSAAGPHTRYNASELPSVSVKVADGSRGTSGSSMPVTVVHAAGSPEAQTAVREILASGTYLSERARAALEATLTPDATPERIPGVYAIRHTFPDGRTLGEGWLTVPGRPRLVLSGTREASEHTAAACRANNPGHTFTVEPY